MLALCLLSLSSGCSLFPDVRHKPQYINPFPQIQTVSVLPFVNQSEEPTLSGERVSLAYINELQSIRGFEVLPLGVVKNALATYPGRLQYGEDFQAFARELGVDVVLVGSVTDYQPYYPPRMALKVSWYAANPAFHPILPGYGLPWGTEGEKDIPRWIQYEAQRALAAEQLKTQTPVVDIPAPGNYPANPPAAVPPPESLIPMRNTNDSNLPGDINHQNMQHGELESGDDYADHNVRSASVEVLHSSESMVNNALHMGGDNGPALPDALPPDWPDPRGFIPDPPQPTKPEAVAQHEPIISHMRNFNGHDEDFTEQLADYFYFNDDARFGGWEAYLQRSEDFIRFCCHLHLVETLAARGGQDKSRLILRWPLDRYSR